MLELLCCCECWRKVVVVVGGGDVERVRTVQQKNMETKNRPRQEMMAEE